MEDKCWACGSEGNHPEWGAHYWPCGTMKSSSIRGEFCYELEIAALQTSLNRSGWNEREGLNRLIEATKSFLTKLEKIP